MEGMGVVTCLVIDRVGRVCGGMQIQNRSCSRPHMMIVPSWTLPFKIVNSFWKFEPEDHTKYKADEVEPKGIGPLNPAGFRFRFAIIPVLADFVEPLWIVRDDSIQLLLYAPLHHVGFIHSPSKDLPICFSNVSHKPCANWSQKILLKHIEGHVGNIEELASIRCGESDMAYWESRQVMRT